MEAGLDAPIPEKPKPPVAARAGLRRRIGKAVAVFAVTVLLLVVSLEVLGRISPSILGPELYLAPKITEEDPGTGVRLVPGVHGRYKIISMPGLPPEVGFRDNGINPGYGRKILALGDSFTFGDGVDLEKNWTEILEPGLGASVVNAGMGATGPEYALAFLDHYGFKLNPDLVLYAFFSGNDLLDVARTEGITLRRFGGARHWLHEHSVTYRASKLVAGRFAPVGQLEMKYYRTSVDGVDVGFWPSMLELNSRTPHSEDLTKSMAATVEIISKMKAQCDGHGTKFAVAVFPFKEQVYFDTVKQWLGNPSEYDRLDPGKTIAKTCAEKGIPVVDLTPLFISRNSKNLYLPSDSHWNEEGYALAAEGLEGFLKELLPEKGP